MTTGSFPQLLHPTVDAVNVREVVTFYASLLGLKYDMPDESGEPDWVSLTDSDGDICFAVQRVESLIPTTWPDPHVPMQLHLDFIVASQSALLRHASRAESLGAKVLLDRSHEDGEQVIVLADPAGHPFCLMSREGPSS